MAPTVTTRRAVSGDAQAIADVWLSARNAAVPDVPPSVHDDADVHQWFRHDVLAHREVWVAEVEGAIAGVLVLEPGWVDQPYVAPEHQGIGLGGTLLDLAKERHPGGLELWTFKTNRRAHRFYERHGFTLAEQANGCGNEERTADRRYRWTT